MRITLISIGKASKMLGYSISTLRRWDNEGKLKALRKGGKRFYKPGALENYINKELMENIDLIKEAKKWASKKTGENPTKPFHCPNSAFFQSKLTGMQDKLGNIRDISETYPLIVSITGEIGNNSFDHNIGKWEDIQGIFFGYNENERLIVLADRGQGILNTLKRVRPKLKSDEEALRVAFTEILSGRSPESRGNGLKFVKQVITSNDFALYFQTGSAVLEINKSSKNLEIQSTKNHINGCLAIIKF